MYNPFSLAGKNILVTGASSGIGRAIAIECSKMGAIVTITGRSEERLQETLSGMEGDGHKYVCADLNNNDDIDTMVGAIDIKLDGVVQCAGYTISKPFQFVSADDLNAIMNVNFMAPFILTQKLLKKKKMEKKSSIVFVSSISGVYVSAIAGSAYSASKGAVNGAMKAMAIELATKGIRVNSVNPGAVETEIFNEGVISQEQLAEDAKKYPMKRYGQPIEIAHGVTYLLSDASSWTTGSTLVIDGGYTLL